MKKKIKPRYRSIEFFNCIILDYHRWAIMIMSTDDVSYIKQTAGNCFIQSTEDVFQALTFETRAAARQYIKVVRINPNFIGSSKTWKPVSIVMSVHTVNPEYLRKAKAHKDEINSVQS